MKYVRAFLSLGLFGFLLLDDEALASVSDAMGAETAAAVSFGAGIVLSLFFMLGR